MLLDIEKNFNRDDRAPVVLGHYAAMDGGNPAYGWIKGLAAADGVLYSDIEMSDELGDLIKSGKYANKSIGIYEDGKDGWRLHHLAILGAAPPRIKGLGQIKLNDVGDADIKTFSYINNGNKKEPEMDEKKVKEMEAKLEELSAKNQEYSQRLEEFKQREKEQNVKNFSAKVDIFADKAKGKMPIDRINKFAEYMKDNKEEFAQDEKMAKVVEKFSELMDSMPKMVDTTDKTVKTNSDDSEPVDTRKMCKEFV